MPEPDPPIAERIREDLFRIPDTCNVYVLRSGREGIAIDFGSGAVLGHLEALGIDRLTDVLVTHHHRDQVQGLDLALAHGANVWVPPVEQDLFRYAEDHWQSRGLDNDYSVRQDNGARSGRSRSPASSRSTGRSGSATSRSRCCRRRAIRSVPSASSRRSAATASPSRAI